MKSGILLPILLLSVSCARMVAPGGGPEDDIPPEIISIDPLPGPGYPDLQKITVKWSERLDDASAIIFLYPQMDYNLNTHGSTMEIELESPIGEKPVVIHLPPEIQDRRGNRTGISRDLVYSGADTLPTGSIGLSMIRQGGGNLSKRTLIEIYQDSTDTPENMHLIRRTRPDSTGTTEIRWLEPGYYRLLCYEDPDRSFEWNPEQEAGFDTTLNLPAGDSLILEPVLSVIDSTGPIITEVEAFDSYHVQISFNEEVSYESFSRGQVTLKDTSGSVIPVYGFWLPRGATDASVILETAVVPQEDITIYISGIEDLMINPSTPDSMVFQGVDSLPSDSIRIRSYYPAPGSDNVNPAGPYNIAFNYWIHLDSLEKRFSLLRISDSTLVQGALIRIDGRSFEFTPEHQLLGEQQHRLELLPGLSTAWADTLLTSFSWSFSSAWGDEPGSIAGEISGTDAAALVLQISRTGGGGDASTTYATVQPGRYEIDEISPGRYTVAAFTDTDGSGIWSAMEPYGTYPGVVLVQPGLITQDVDIEILP